MELNFDEYWKKLIDKISHTKENVSPNDLLFYQLTCIRGETMVNGIVAYFDRRYKEFESDMKVLKENGFQDIAELFNKAKTIMFGEKELSDEIVEETIMGLLAEEPQYNVMQKKIDEIYTEIIEKINKFDDYRMEYGIKNGLFTSC